MDQDYDRKFEEMKKYIPFLESMIKRLENTSSSSNPRQAQLDKIRSLRDLLLDKKKRMKMDNLLKCEQVLVNLYTKVEQKDALPGLKSVSDSIFPSNTKDTSDDLEAVRNKLKTVTKIQQEQDTLPEIARASATEELCTPGSKEPALFQRRPNKASISPGANNPNTASASKRNYTRVLVSPDISTKRWSNGEENSGSPLFSRRSPRRSPKRYSPTYNKKERKKSKQKPYKNARDLNITLNVPEDSLDSLNTKDILTRIMNCSDNDVDIESLREAKRQILNELKHTGAKCDDISDLLLKSYKKKNLKKKDEVEEGELSDSESEAIQSIYGNFILDADKNTTTVKNDADAGEVPRKIQICLVINSDNNDQTGDVTDKDKPTKPHDTALTDFEMYDEPSASTKPVVVKDFKYEDSKNIEQNSTVMQEKSATKTETENKAPNNVEVSAPLENNQPANFYKPLHDQISSNPIDKLIENKNKVNEQGNNTASSKVLDNNENRSSFTSSTNELTEITKTTNSEIDNKESVEIPLLNDPSIATQKPPKEDVVSEIDILQALKNEILSESLSIPGSETTPLLHQPKVTKVSSAQEIAPKKRISIEKYKKKAVESAKPALFLHDLSNSIKDDNAKKQSLKLTEKECERFNFSSKLAFEDEESEGDEFSNDISLDDVYGNLVPKSPDINESQRTKSIAPVIIPVEPVTTKLTPSKSDVDMRMFAPLLSPNTNTPTNVPDDTKQRNQDTISADKSRTPIDPRVRKDFNQTVNIESSKVVNSDRIPKLVPPLMNFTILTPGSMTPGMSPSMTPSVTPGIIPSMTPNRTPNIIQNMNPCMTPTMAPHMTPSRNPSMTPSRNPSMTPNARTYEVISQQNFDTEDNDASRKHVYAPMFSLYDQRESKEQSVSREQEPRSYWDRSDVETRRHNSRWETIDLADRNQRYNNIQKDVHTRHDRRDSFNRSDCTQIPFARTDCPNTPSHPFGRIDAPPTPINPFSWSDCPSTPGPQFGRLDCPQTPNPSFGRSDCPLTPSHPFGRVDCPTTPIHPFGRSDMPMTPSHPFGRSEHQSRDPRLNRSSDYDNVQNDDRGRQHHRDRSISNYNRYSKSTNQNHQREQNFGKNEKNNYSSHEHNDRYHNRDRDVRNSMPREFDNDRHFKDRQRENLGSDNFNTNDVNHGHRKNFYRERSVGRSTESVDRMPRASYSQTNKDIENRLSVKPHTGKSFTIDTSINSTFQGFLEGDNNIKTFDSKFDRRKRAASVGRVLCREPSVGRTSRRDSSVERSFQRESSLGRSLGNESKQKKCMDHSKQNQFRRARSVGRDMYNTDSEKSFKDIKIDFENYKAKYDANKKLTKSETLLKSENFENCKAKYDSNKKLTKSETLLKSENFENCKAKYDSTKKLTKSETLHKSEIKQDKHNHFKESNHRINHKYKIDNRPRVKSNADPRNLREFDNHKNRYKEDMGRDRNKKTAGIVYSNDNITKGKILGSGYGVKNYKIPKIKRPVEEEKPVQSEKEEAKCEKKEMKSDCDKSNDCNIKDKNSKSQNKVDVKSDTIKGDSKLTHSEKSKKTDKNEKSDKRITRLSKKSDTGSSESINDSENTTLRPRRNKKPLVYNSDSDTEEDQERAKKTIEKEITTAVKKCENIVTKTTGDTGANEQKKSLESSEPLQKLPEKAKEEDKEKDVLPSTNDGIQNTININTSSDMDNQFDSNFAMDDMEIFSDNIPSDSVIDNINALIANLDSDLEPSKVKTPTEFTNDISLENMLEDINSDEESDMNVLSENFKDISDVIEKDLEATKEKELNTFENNVTENGNKSNLIKSPSKITHNSENKGDNDTHNVSKINSCNSDNIVTTTAIDKHTVTDVQVPKNTLDNTAAPDSTNEILDKKSDKEEGLPDSTNDTQNDTSSMVTSSHDPSETDLKDNELRLSTNNEGTSIDSIGNILSILQNKSKLKEILNMLGDKSSENEKIKKKLEKLSELVSDEDDDVDKNASDEVKDNRDNSVQNVEERKDINEQAIEAQSGSIGIIQESGVEKSVDENKVMLTENHNIEVDKSVAVKQSKKPIKKGKVTRKGKGKVNRKVPPKGLKRITRSGAKESKPKKPSRELLQLQEDIREMFISHDVLNTTGIRMCRLAKLVDEVSTKQKDMEPSNQESPEPIVVLKKFKDNEITEETRTPEKIVRKRPNTKGKSKFEDLDAVLTSKKSQGYRPGPKSKTKPVNKSDDEDPYAFESDSVSESNYNMKSIGDKVGDSSESENESVASSKSCGSSQLLVEVKKKPKRKKSAWQAGIIKPKNKKKKTENKQPEFCVNDDVAMPKNKDIVPDLKCFTDKSYCFQMHVSTYKCRFCPYSGEDIVNHYKQNHSHTEIPLSRPSPEMAKQAIEQCEEINFQAISKMPSDIYVCRFCFKEFGKKRSSLEAFFWHIVSMHTGEYKHPCTSCPSAAKCPFNLDIPPPPKDTKGQLIGYICEKCNFTQISLENLKTHVIVRHNDEKTEVYIINLSVLSLKAITTLAKQCSAETETPRVLRSRQLSHSMTEASDDLSDVTDSDISSEQLTSRKSCNAVTSPTLHERPKTKYQSKISFETDDNTSETSSIADSVSIKKELDLGKIKEDKKVDDAVVPNTPNKDSLSETIESAENNVPADIFALPHFKVKYNDGGSKEYVCCINGQENHYKTTLLISFKKHVQLKHSEIWDGYCFICKVIVTPQGKYKFQDCLHHYIDKHIDTMPVLENTPDNKEVDEQQKPEEPSPPPPAHKPYINVRPLSELMCTEASVEVELPTLPKIENVMSLGAPLVELPPSSPLVAPEPVPQVKENKHEEIQAEVMSKKHRVVLSTMMNQIKLVHLFKCAGRFCSFTSNNPEESLVHASTHQNIGGENSLSCAYCEYDCAGNGIDLVMHVFKDHITSPYVCAYCFYRAASSQLVSAHISRIHNGKPTLVLSACNTTPPPLKTSSMLPREAVVQYYVCPHACKFRTYTAGKYCEHLLQRHSTEPRHPCYICSETSETPVQLIQHLKCHELNVYQCTWCVHGASTEGNLIYHTSQKHPDQQPQAYLRVITNKDGSSEFRVLPLASFNKTKVSVTTVAPNDVVEDAAREAERSLDLEKLIGDTNRLIESSLSEFVAEMIPEPIVEPIAELIAEPILDSVSIVGEAVPTEKDDGVVPERVSPALSPLRALLATKGPPPALVAAASDRPPAALKLEPGVAASAKDSLGEVVCLDSDDDEPPPPPSSPPPSAAPAALPSPPSAASANPAEKRLVSTAQLLRCPSCLSVSRTAHTFRRHTGSCCPAGALHCPHCSLLVPDAEELLKHYQRDHSTRLPFTCFECAMRFESAAVAKRHLKYTHRVTGAVVVAAADGACVVRPAPAPAPAAAPAASRRKRSSGAGAEQLKLARYGPQDAHLLPINPILDEAVFCAVCEFKTKVRLNMVRHLQLHAERQPAPNTAPVNPVPHLETNEMHFDRMVNLASSSIGSAPRAGPAPTVAAEGGALGAEAGSRYPRAVGERARLACGARGCSYISLDEDMLRRHWDALHAGSNDFRCVHCPPYQHLDTTRPLTGARIVAHLKMHDAALYACSACTYYHYRRVLVDKHVAEAHGTGAGARSLVVREPPPAPAPPAPAAPTMDLKPWHCGLCAFLSMLRPEVVDHCARLHQSKMQFKCMYCPFRTSAKENVTKHQANSHPGKKADVFYYYYREGSVEDEPDGTPRWRRQRDKFGPAEVKSEVAEEADASAEAVAPPKAAEPPKAAAPLNLDIVKREAEEPGELSALCARYGALCAPNGLTYKCPLCKEGSEDTEEDMRSHLYEELKYRRWACAICSYKAFHNTGLNEHMLSEHRGQNQQPTLLPPDTNIEKWVNSVLAHQTEAINKNKENLAKQKIITEKPSTSTSSEKSVPKPPEKPAEKFSMTDLEKAFGQFGVPNNMYLCCPKCNYRVRDENSMRDHLETELSKIRWCCSNCTEKFQTYHEAQFHCKSVHSRVGARPVEASRDFAFRAAWVAAVLQVQRLSMRCLPLTELPDTTEKTAPPQDLPENSLLVVRHEESVSTSEESLRRKRPAPRDDSEDERLVIDEPSGPPMKRKFGTQCPYCEFSSKYNVKDHVYRHYKLKPYQCPHCKFTGHRQTVAQHIESEHEFEPKEPIKVVPLPSGPPPIINLINLPIKSKKPVEEENAKVCLVCETAMSNEELESHAHNGVATLQIASKGDVVVKCCICLALRKDVSSITEHHNTAHPSEHINYAFFKFLHGTRSVHCCGHCDKRFKYLKDIKPHHEASHASLILKYQTIPYSAATSDVDNERDSGSSMDFAPPAAKRVARKSTSKLPAQAVARKSTTKLPFVEDNEAGYSFYGTKPAPLEQYENVTTTMSFCNTMVAFTLRKLNDILTINPVVLVQDINKK